jgi:peroxiredoxin
VYAVSPATPEEHRQLAEDFGLSLRLLSDEELEFGLTFGFIDVEEESIYRGFVAVNPASKQMVVKTDYLFGQNVDEIIELMKEL